MAFWSWDRGGPNGTMATTTSLHNYYRHGGALVFLHSWKESNIRYRKLNKFFVIGVVCEHSHWGGPYRVRNWPAVWTSHIRSPWWHTGGPGSLPGDLICQVHRAGPGWDLMWHSWILPLLFPPSHALVFQAFQHFGLTTSGATGKHVNAAVISCHFQPA